MAELKLAQESSKLKYDVHRAPAPTFNMWDMVMLLCWNIRMMWPSEKFDYQKLGPFKVISWVGNNAYRLELPETLSRLHLIFNINLLEPYTLPSSFPDRLQKTSPVPNVVLERGNILKLKDVLDVQKISHQFDYLVEFLNKPMLEHQQTLVRLLGAPEHQEHWEHWDSISPSRNDQQCHSLVRSCQESHDLSGALPPFQEWLEVLDLPDCI